MTDRRQTPRSFAQSANALDRLLAPIMAAAVEGDRGWFPVARLADAARMNRTDALSFLRKINHPDSLIEMRHFARGWHVRMNDGKTRDEAFQSRFAQRLAIGMQHGDANVRALCGSLASIAQGRLEGPNVGAAVAPRMFQALSARVEREPQLKEAVLEAASQLQTASRNSDEK